MLGCLRYQRETEFAVRDPEKVTFEGDASPEVKRARDHSARSKHLPLLEADGTVVAYAAVFGPRAQRDEPGLIGDATPSFALRLDDVTVGDDEVKTNVCLDLGPKRAGCVKSIALVTPTENVRVLRERDKPIRWLGVAEMIAGGLVITAGAVSLDPGKSGGAILVGLGAVLAAVGIVQTVAPATNESAPVPEK
jgi:hypothetical protein